jgi:uncharacterized membrane protein
MININDINFYAKNEALQYVGNNWNFSVQCETCRYQCLENLFSSSSSSSGGGGGIGGCDGGVGGGGGCGGGSNSSAFRSQVTPGDPIGLC